MSEDNSDEIVAIPFRPPTQRDHWLRAIEIACEQDGGDHFLRAVTRPDCEEAVVQLTLWSAARHGHNGILRSTLYKTGDRIQRELHLRHPLGGSGAVDLAVHHASGGTSLIEVKDGRCGWRSTVAGIGQVCGYAAMATAMGVDVRSKILLWSPVPGLPDQSVIDEACKEAGVVPVHGWGMEQVVQFILSLDRKVQRSIIEEHYNRVGWPEGKRECFYGS